MENLKENVEKEAGVNAAQPPSTSEPQQQQIPEPERNPAPQDKPTTNAEDDEDSEEDEKDNSQKLVIDINDEDEEEEDEEEELEKDEIMEQKATKEIHPTPSELTDEKKKDTSTKVADKKTTEAVPKVVADDIITLSDAEEDAAVEEASIKPGKVQKRKSVGSTNTNEEERYRLKRRKINAEGAPKMPLTGYVRYMNDRRDALRKEHPTKNSIDITKVIAEEWQALSTDVKAGYLKAAEEDKQRYVKELHTFLKSRPDILASELAKNKVRKTDGSNNAKQGNDNSKSSKDAATKEKVAAKEPQSNTTTSSSQNSEKPQNNEKSRRKRSPTPPYTNAAASSSTSSAATSTGPSTSAAAAASVVISTPGEVPIFTNEFLEHNKTYDMELRSLRKSKTDLEQQNFVLEKHVENMKCGVEKMVAENDDLQEKNRLLEIYLDKLKRKLAQALAALPLPSAPNGATVDNIDKYMQDLYKMSTSNSHGPATLNKAKDIIRKLDLQIQL